MPDLSQYQTVFRIAKPNAPKRGASSRRKLQPNGAEPAEQNDNVAKAQARLQKLEDMVTMLMQSNHGTDRRNGQPTPASAETSTGPAATSTAASSSCGPLPTPEAHSNGHLDVSGSETKYLGATHYLSILENVGPDVETDASHF
jgi:hypothetical protein